MSSIEGLFEIIREGDIKYIDFRFTDLRGRWRHITYHISCLDEAMFGNGFFLESASLFGARLAEESSILLKPDIETAIADPFAAQPQLILFCDVFEVSTGNPHPCCPRGIAKKAQAYLRKSGIADALYLSPDIQFFVFDDVRYTIDINKVSFELDAGDAAWSSGREFEQGNWAHRPNVMDGYLSMSPLDGSIDLRAEMASTLIDMGVPIEGHNHEAASPQHKLGMRWAALLAGADQVQLYKYVVHMVAHSYGKTATFMPKPLVGDSGSRMSLAQSLWKEDTPLFPGSGYAGLSDIALFYIGGLIKHARVLNAFANATTNSYKRFAPDVFAPTVLAYSANNPQAAYSIPYEEDPGKRCIVAQYPDPAANAYITYAAMMLAGLDGIRNKVHPGDSLDGYGDGSSEKNGRMREQKVSHSLRDALGHLKTEHSFLLQGGVFSSQFVECYIETKLREVSAFERTPHPLEYKLYYSA